MFGHDDHHVHDDNNATMPAEHVEPTPDGNLSHGGMLPSAPAAPAVTDTSAGNFMSDDADDTVVAAPPAPADDVAMPAAPAPAAPAVQAPAVAAPAPAASDDLLDIKQQALQQLSPLVDHLDQTPEEKFRTTMMMIQAADNQALIKDAYAAAQQIPDEKARAQALLDIVNEINYFTQHAADDTAAAA